MSTLKTDQALPEILEPEDPTIQEAILAEWFRLHDELDTTEEHTEEDCNYPRCVWHKVEIKR